MPILRVNKVSTAIWLIATFFIIATLLVRSVFLYLEYREAVINAEAASQQLVRLTEEYVRRTVQTADLVAATVESSIAEQGGLQTFSRGDARWYLSRLARKTVGSYILVIAADGTPVASSLAAEPADVNLADRAYFKAHVDGADLVVGPAINSRLSAEVLFTVTRAVRDPGGSLEAVIQIAIPPTFFQEAVNRTRYENEMAGLWTLTGEVVGWTGLTEENVGFSLREGDLSKVIVGGSGTFIDRFVGERRVISYSQVDGRPLVVTGSVPFYEAMAPVRRSLLLTGLLFGPLLLGLAGLAHVGARLARRQEALTDELATTNTALAEARDALQQKVADRTSELARSNASLSHSEAKMRAVFDSTVEFMVLLDPSGRIMEANKAAAAFAGIEPSRLVGMMIWDVPVFGQSGDFTAPQMRAAVQRAAAGEPLRREVTLRPVGRRVIADYALKPIFNAADEVTALLSEGRDITDMRETQERLHESQKVETLGHLTGGVAHDFNNILMAVSANLELLRKRVGGSPELQRLIDLSQHGVDRGATLTQRLLAFARRQELVPVPFMVTDLFGDLEALLRPTMDPAIALLFNAPVEVPAILADRAQTELALLNLCLNARDAMPDGGTIRIEARQGGQGLTDAPEGFAAAGHVCISVTDTGSGMDSATLARAVEPFYTTKGPGKGSGLGLPMVQGVAAQSGGAFVLRSEPGIGTTAELWLPVVSQDRLIDERMRADAPGKPVEGRDVGSLRILVVDDDYLVSMGTAAMLEDLGHTVVEADTALRALDIIRENPDLDVVITDFAMPGMNGQELMKQIERERPGLPMVLASGFADLPQGVDEIPHKLTKPFRQSQVAALLATLFSDRAARHTNLRRG